MRSHLVDHVSGPYKLYRRPINRGNLQIYRCETAYVGRNSKPSRWSKEELKKNKTGMGVLMLSIGSQALSLGHPGRHAAGVFAAAVLSAAALPAAAIEPAKDEKARLKACEEQVCRTILDKPQDKKPVSCDISKTWAGDKIQDGAKKKQIVWSFGDAHCRLRVRLNKTDIVKALTEDVYKWGLPEHTVKCTVEQDGKPEPVSVRVDPKISFEKGKVYKVRLRLKDVDAPPLIKSLIWTTAKLHDNVGLLRGEIVEEINEFVHQKCEKRYGVEALRRAARLEAKKKRKQKRKARAAAKAKLKAATEKAQSQ